MTATSKATGVAGNGDETAAGARIIEWASLTKAAFDRIDRATAVVLVSCAPIEVHGPHLPMGADFLEGEGLMRRMAARLPERHRGRTFLALPPIYAATDVLPQPGSLHFRASTTIAVLEDLGRTLARQGFREIVVSNFHGSPRHFLAIEAACDRTSRRHGVRMVSLFSLMLTRLLGGGATVDEVIGAIVGLPPAELRGDSHAGFIETAQLLALHPDLVDPSYRDLERRTVEQMQAREGEPTSGYAPGARRSLGTLVRNFRAVARFFAVETYSGAPAGATAEAGERIIDALATRSAEAYAEVLDGKIAATECHSPVWPMRFLFLNPICIRIVNKLIGWKDTIS